MAKELEANIKIYTRTVEHLRELKKRLKLKSIKETIVVLYEAYVAQPEHSELAVSRAEIKAMQGQIHDLCEQIRARLDEPVPPSTITVNIAKIIDNVSVEPQHQSIKDAVSKALIDAIRDVEAGYEK